MRREDIQFARELIDASKKKTPYGEATPLPFLLLEDAIEEIELLRLALQNAIRQLNMMTPLLQTDEHGNGPDCSAHFQAIIGATNTLHKAR